MTDTASWGDTARCKRARYLNPFEGRKKRIHLSGLFLFDPDVMLRIYGCSMQTIFVEMGFESLFKGLERVSRTGRLSRRLKEKFLALLPPSIQELFRDALDGKVDAVQRVGKMGPWEGFSQGFLDGPEDKSMGAELIRFLCAVERASRPAVMLYQDGRGSDATQLLANNELLRHFISSKHLSDLSVVDTFDGLLPIRASIALEVWLSFLAKWDIMARPGDTDDAASYLFNLVPEEGDDKKNTVALMFDWLLNASRMSTIGELTKDARLQKTGIDGFPLGAWSRGENFPRLSYVKVISKALLGKEDESKFMTVYSMARHLNFLGYIVQRLEVVKRPDGMELEAGKTQSQFIPFDHDTFGSWLRGRYPFWLNYHRVRLAGLS